MTAADAVPLGARLLLAGVFALAGVTKLADRPSTRAGLTAFGVPTSAIAAVSLILPVGELVVAVLLLLSGTAWWGAIGCLVLLLIFLAAIGYQLARGRRPECRCFGQLHAKPVSWFTVLRNGLLAAVAGLLVGLGPSRQGTSAVAWVEDLTTGERGVLAIGLLTLAAIGVQARLLGRLSSQHEKIFTRLGAVETWLAALSGDPESSGPGAEARGLPEGTPGPEFELADLEGTRTSLGSLLGRGLPALLVFVQPECHHCAELLPDLARWEREEVDQFTVIFVAEGGAKANRKKFTHYGLRRILLQEASEVADQYKVEVLPSAVMVAADGKIASALAGGPDAVRALLTRITPI